MKSTFDINCFDLLREVTEWMTVSGGAGCRRPMRWIKISYLWRHDNDQVVTKTWFNYKSYGYFPI